LRGRSGSGNPFGLVDASASGANLEAGSEREIVFPPRDFRDVHQLVFLFQSWQVLLEADLPPALQPLKEIPEDLEPVVAKLLRDARTQLENAQQDVEISLRFPATPEIVSLLQWAAVQLREIEGLTEDPDLDPAWIGALALAKEFVDTALAQLAVEPLA
jgi:hypothetical protein